MYTESDPISRIHADIQRDVTDRADWSQRQRDYRDWRLCRDKRRLQPYPGAPDLREPIIDDNIAMLTSNEIQILWNARVLAVFIPYDSMGMEYKRVVECAFDTMLRRTLRSRAKLESLFDLKNERGSSVAKLVTNTTALKGAQLPDFDLVDPLDIVTPTNTRHIKDSDRVTHIIRYTVREFLQKVETAGWDKAVAQKLIDTAMSSEYGGKESKNTGVTKDDNLGSFRTMWLGETLPCQEKEIIVYECYHFKKMQNIDPLSGAVSEEIGRFVTVIPESLPDEKLIQYEWRWEPSVTQNITVDPVTGQPVMVSEMVKGDWREWPFVQFRYENRSLLFYDVRGAAKKLEQDQRFANANWTAMCIHMDYAAKPFIKGEGAKNFRWRPGEVLPSGVELVAQDFGRQLEAYQYNIDMSRSMAARRTGAPMGSLSSADKSRQSKTATETSITAQMNSLFASDAVERFSEPLADLFTMMWEYLQHNPAPLIAMMGNDQAVPLPQEAFKSQYIVVPGVTGKSANPDILIQQLIAVSQLLGMFPQGSVVVRASELYKWVFDQIDPKISEKLVVDPSQAGPQGQPPIEQQVAQLGQMLLGPKGDGKGGMAEAVGSMQQYMMAIAQHDAVEKKGGNESSVETKG